MLDAFMKSAEFRAEMAAEARREAPAHEKRAYGDVVNCYVRWRNDRPSASELGAVRKLDSTLAAKSIVELRGLVGDSPRLLLLTAATPRQAAALRRSAERHDIIVEIEPP
jgi:hypothetical protein